MPHTNRRSFLTASAAAVGGLMMSGSASSRASGRLASLPQPSLTSDELQQRLGECLGGAWPEPCELQVTLEKSEQAEGFRREWIRYQVETGDFVAAIVLIPDGVSNNSPAPAVAVWHQHNGEWHLGKSEPAGLAGNPEHHAGVALAKLGYVVICPDALCFEERRDPEGKLDGSSFERFEFLRYTVGGTCMAWKNILDMRRAIDVLCQRPEVQADRLGCYGHSMGSTHTWLVGPWEPRLKCLVGNCCLPTYDAIHRTKILHCFPNFVPGFHKFADTPEIAGLIAPRALHLNFGELDGGSPIKEVRDGIERIAAMYTQAEAADRFSSFIEPGVGHVLSEAMWQQTQSWFGKHL